MTKLFKQTLQYSNSGHADWIRDIEWYSIPIRKIAGIEGKKQAGYCPVANTIELAAVEWSNNVRIQKWREAKLNERSRTN